MRQIRKEIDSCLEFLNHIYGIFGFEFELMLSTRPEKYMGDVEVWNHAEAVSSCWSDLASRNSERLSTRSGGRGV